LSEDRGVEAGRINGFEASGARDKDLGQVTAHPTGLNNEQLRRLSAEVARIAAALAELSIRSTALAPATKVGDTTGRKEQIDISPEVVRWLIAARRDRARYLPSELFADPAWDILLDLLQAELTHGTVAVSSLCIAAAVPATTGLRWINHMVKRGLLNRRQDPHDGRRVYVELAPEVSRSLRRYVAEAALPSQVLIQAGSPPGAVR
jgi:DNA-binding MarR family transcriptional regulator